MNLINILDKFKKKKYPVITVDPDEPEIFENDPEDPFDPVQELLRTKDELIERLKYEIELLQDAIVELNKTTKDISIKEPIKRFMPWSEARAMIEQKKRDIAKARKDEEKIITKS